MSDTQEYGQRKRMRKGTHSCNECRERKVKCIFSSEREICDDCLRRGRPCLAQTEERQSPTSYDPAKSTREHLREIDQNIKQILQRLDRPPEVGKGPDLKAENLNGLLEELQLELCRSRLRPTTTGLETMGSPSTVSSDQNRSETAFFKSRAAPMLSLMDNSVLNGQMASPVEGSETKVLSRTRDSSAVTGILRSLIPSPSDLLPFLTATKCTWDMWESLFPQLREQATNLREPADYILLCNEISKLVGTGEPAGLAKVLFCLANCIQQLPEDFDFLQTNLPLAPERLQVSYLSAAESVLSMDHSLGNTIDGVECMLIQSTFYVNKGKPRTAWLICQRGISICHVVGVDGSLKADTPITMRWKSAWFQFWSRDRQLSLLLGLPQASTSEQSSLVELGEKTGKEKWQAVWTNLSILAGRLINRNRSPDPTDLKATLGIEADMELLKQVMTPEWDTSDLGDGQKCVKTMVDRKLTKFVFHNTRKLLHLPFMLKSMEDKRYDYSREAAVDSSRQMIRVYQKLRSGDRPVLSLCSVEDFQVFTAALVLVIHLLDPGQGNMQSTRLGNISDWQLIEQITDKFSEVAKKRGCKVALDASKFLQDVLRSRYDFPCTETGRYEATIPYFGKISLNRRLPSPSGTTFENVGPDMQNYNDATDLASQQPGDLNLDMNLAPQAELSWYPTSDQFSWPADGPGWPIPGDYLGVDTNNYWWEP